MAKKNMSRAKSEPKAQAATPVEAPPKPTRARPSRAAAAKPADQPSDTVVVIENIETTTISISDDEIRVRAYHRYLERGGNHGADFQDWVEAERDLRERK